MGLGLGLVKVTFEFQPLSSRRFLLTLTSNYRHTLPRLEQHTSRDGRSREPVWLLWHALGLENTSFPFFSFRQQNFHTGVERRVDHPGRHAKAGVHTFMSGLHGRRLEAHCEPPEMLSRAKGERVW